MSMDMITKLLEMSTLWVAKRTLSQENKTPLLEEPTQSQEISTMS